MFVIRLIANGEMYYLVDIDQSYSAALLTTWALVGNKIKTFVNEQSAIRSLEQIQEYPAKEHVLAQWDDSEELIAMQKGEPYLGKPFEPTSIEIQIIDLSDMVIARTWKQSFME